MIDENKNVLDSLQTKGCGLPECFYNSLRFYGNYIGVGHHIYKMYDDGKIGDKPLFEIDFELPDGFVTDRRDELNHSSVMFKVYEEKDLIEEDLLKDLNIMLEVYTKFIPIYGDVLDELNLEPKAHFDDYDNIKEEIIKVENRNIWRVAAGESQINDLVWEDFKNNNYVGIGNWGIKKELNYND